MNYITLNFCHVAINDACLVIVLESRTLVYYEVKGRSCNVRFVNKRVVNTTNYS